MIEVERRVRLHGRPGHARAPRAAALSAGRRKPCSRSLNKIVTERPDGKGGMAPLRDLGQRHAATCERSIRRRPALPDDDPINRIAPGETNTWFIEVLGTKSSIRFSTAT